MTVTAATIQLMPGSNFTAGGTLSLGSFAPIYGRLNIVGTTFSDSTGLLSVGEGGTLAVLSGNFDKSISRMAGTMIVAAGAAGPNGLITTLSGRLDFGGTTASGGIINMAGQMYITAGTLSSAVTTVASNASIVMSGGTFNGAVFTLSGLLQLDAGSWSGSTTTVTSSGRIYGVGGTWSGAICINQVMAGNITVLGGSWTTAQIAVGGSITGYFTIG